MYYICKKPIILIAVAALLIIPFGSHALAEEQIVQKAPDGGAMVVDLLMVRPLGILGFVTCFTLYCVSAPFSAMGGNIGTAWEQMVVAPANFTFARPLGEY